jgi:hypothetical protein
MINEHRAFYCGALVQNRHGKRPPTYPVCMVDARKPMVAPMPQKLHPDANTLPEAKKKMNALNRQFRITQRRAAEILNASVKLHQGEVILN